MRSYFLARVVLIVLLSCAIKITCSAQTFQTIATFNGANGAGPWNLVEDFDGNLYGTTSSGGSENGGIVFKMTPKGSLTTILSFASCSSLPCTEGEAPFAGLVQSPNGNFYGTTYEGGVPFSYGTVFEITSSGELTTLHSFAGVDGIYPRAGVIQGRNGSFYGTTSQGGNSLLSDGTVFEITAAGSLTTLHSFCSETNCTDGANPYTELLQAANGNFYGTTAAGGGDTCDLGCGTIFMITPDAKLTTLYNLCSEVGCQDGVGASALIQANNGNFYGTMSSGGGYGSGSVFELNSKGELTTIYNFCSKVNCSDGADPTSGVIQATDGNFYGVTQSGGLPSTVCPFSGCGTLFRLTPAGKLTTLYRFCSQSNCVDGAIPVAALTQTTDGSFYGTTAWGGGSSNCSEGALVGGCGTIFHFSIGLAPFVKTLPTTGKVSENIIIFGSELTDTTEVSFNGTSAVFQVLSSNKIEATVPIGATTGTIEVTTTGGTLKSNVPFLILPQ
jgi:uncharacterized repeat protein (TIGR03803 family)